MTFFSTSRSGRSLTWTGDNEYLRIDPWGANSVRVRASKMCEPSDNEWALLPVEDAAPAGGVNDSSIEIDEEKDCATFANGDIVVRAKAGHWPYGSSGYEEYRCVLSFWKKDGAFLFQELPEGGSLNLKARSYQSLPGGAYSITASFIATETERLWGMGEYQQNVLDLKGCLFELAHRNSQASIPFVVSSAGYGFLWNNPAIGSATFAKNKTVWHADSTTQIDYWVTVGDDPAQIERQYADVTGHAPVMPEWGLGYWQCKLRYWNQEQLLETAREFKRRHIPLDVIVIDFFHWPHMGDYRFEKEFWPDPRTMCDELHEMGIKVMVSVWPQVSLESENYVEMKGKNLLVAAERGENIGMMFEGPSQFLDVTNPTTREYVWNKCKQNYANLGVDAFWLDEAEPEYGSYDFDNYSYQLGPNGRIGNLYPREFNRGFYEGQAAAGRTGQIVNLTRCAWAGSQRYGALVWSGDVGSTFADLKAQITCAIHMGMAGIPWFTTDMGGFHDGDINSEAFRELFIRWAQFSCFSPVMRNHGDRSALQPDGSVKALVSAADGTRRSPSGADNEPWSMGKRVEEILIKYIGIRERLRPYTRELFAAAHEDGQPLVRGLFYDFPDDPGAATISDQYMFGPDLLVAPVLEPGARSRSVYLPSQQGTRWLGLNDGQEYEGGRVVEVDAGLDVIPIFARNGAHHGLLGMI